MGFLNKKKAEVDFVSNNKKAAEEFQNIGSALGNLGHVAGSQAKIAGGRAMDKAQEGYDWAQPRVQKALDELVRLSDEAKQEGEKAAKKGRKNAKKGRKQVENDYLPRLQRALHDATDAAKSGGSITKRAQNVGKATQKALTEPTAKRKAKRGGAVFGWILVGTVAAGAGYLLWRRTQPTEDPWAEEYWDDTTTATAPVGTYQEGHVTSSNQPGAGDATTSQSTGTRPGGPGQDTDDAAKDAIATEEKVGDTTADDSRPGEEDRKLGEL